MILTNKKRRRKKEIAIYGLCSYANLLNQDNLEQCFPNTHVNPSLCDTFTIFVIIHGAKLHLNNHFSLLNYNCNVLFKTVYYTV